MAFNWSSLGSGLQNILSKPETLDFGLNLLALSGETEQPVGFGEAIGRAGLGALQSKAERQERDWRSAYYSMQTAEWRSKLNKEERELEREAKSEATWAGLADKHKFTPEQQLLYEAGAADPDARKQLYKSLVTKEKPQAPVLGSKEYLEARRAVAGAEAQERARYRAAKAGDPQPVWGEVYTEPQYDTFGTPIEGAGKRFQSYTIKGKPYRARLGPGEKPHGGLSPLAQPAATPPIGAKPKGPELFTTGDSDIDSLDYETLLRGLSDPTISEQDKKLFRKRLRM